MVRRVGREGRSAIIGLVPVLVLVVLTTATVLVWQFDLEHQLDLRARHSQDVAVQTAKRLEERIEAHLRVATLLARRWSSDEDRGSSEQRFTDFAKMLMDELPAFEGLVLVDPAGKPWSAVPRETNTIDWIRSPDGRHILREAMRASDTVVSAPVDDNDHTAVFAAIPLDHDEAHLGFLVVHFHAETLVAAGLRSHVLSEFSLVVDDTGLVLFAALPSTKPGADTPLLVATEPTGRATATIAVRNRSWRLSIHPLDMPLSSWIAMLPEARLGVLMSAGISLLVYMLLHRMRAFRRARDEALAQSRARQRVEEALRSTEARYRDVFKSITDGMVVLEHGRVVEANGAAAVIYGTDSAALAGAALASFYPKELREQVAAFLASAELNLARMDATVLRRNGGRIEVEMRASLLAHEAKPRVFLIVTDVSERKRAMERQQMLSRKVLLAQEEERARVARELHDELGQLLTAIRLEMGLLRKRLEGKTALDTVGFDDAVRLVEHAADESRRICRGLRPPLLDDLGLAPAARLLVQEFEERSDLEVRYSADLEEEGLGLPHEVALCTYRILQECLTNVGRHARAKLVEVSLAASPMALTLAVRDDGVGFAARDLSGPRGIGIEGMRERARLVGGSLDILSAPGAGTTVSFHAALAGAPKEGVA